MGHTLAPSIVRRNISRHSMTLWRLSTKITVNTSWSRLESRVIRQSRVNFGKVSAVPLFTRLASAALAASRIASKLAARERSGHTAARASGLGGVHAESTRGVQERREA